MNRINLRENIAMSEKDDLDKQALEYLGGILICAVASEADTVEIEWIPEALQISLREQRLLSVTWQKDPALAEAFLKLIISRAGLKKKNMGRMHWRVEPMEITTHSHIPRQDLAITVERYERSGKSCLRLKLEGILPVVRRFRPVRRAQ